MSVMPMKRVMIAGMRKDRKKILELLQRRGDVELRFDTDGLNIGQDDPVFGRDNMNAAKAGFERYVAAATSALTVLDTVHPGAKDGNMFSGREILSLADYESRVARIDETLATVNKLNDLAKKQAELQSEIPKLEDQIEALTPWMALDIPLDFDGTENTKTFIGSFPGESNIVEIENAIEAETEGLTGVQIDVVSQSKEQMCVAVYCLKKDAEAVEEALRRHGFARPVVSGAVPTEQKETMTARRAEAEAEIAKVAQEIDSYYGSREDIKFCIDYFRLRADKYEVISSIPQSKRTFLVNGFIAAEDAKSLEAQLTANYDCTVEFEDCAKDDPTVPVKFKNNAYSAPLEGVIKGYALPGIGEIDPSMVAAVFYYALFGMMLSDAGYGCIIFFGCIFLLNKYKNTMEDGMRKTLRMFRNCGLATIIWGFIFGSFFGDTINVVASHFFNRPDIGVKALWVVPVEKPVAVLALAFVIGIVHLFTGLLMNGYQSLKQGKIMDAVCDCGFWFCWVGGAIIFLLGTEMIRGMFNIQWMLPPAIKTLSIAMMIIGLVGILLFEGRTSKNPVKRILKGVYGIYNTTGWLSDVLSYSRLLALGLATSVIASVFNQIGTLAGKGVFGAIFFIVLFIIGHTLNILINALGAYVHTNRLTYAEFFGKFYNGGGEEFHPFTENTTYFRVKES